MNELILILLIVAAVKFVFFGVLLWVVFKPDLRHFLKEPKPPSSPICVFCQSRWTHQVGVPETRWEGESFVIVTTYECQHCHFPTTHIERVPAPMVKR